MKANFYLGFEFGYSQDTIEVDVVSRTSDCDYMIVKLPEGHNSPFSVTDDGFAIVSTDYLDLDHSDLPRIMLPMWSAEHEREFKDCIQ